ncbi:MAG: DUF1080 domain-containing protein [Candidatus Omnitrophica bacterium]|nr:DUF1080 domain-containing protein [Candidatus Omnitrophota bacterium]
MSRSFAISSTLVPILILSAFAGEFTRKLFVPPELGNFIVFPEGSEAFSVDEEILKCSGQPIGYLRTKEDYENYRLTLEWRWPGEPGNNGVLLHIVGEDKVWPKSFEAQLQHGQAGDIWVIDGADFKEHTNKADRRVVKKVSSSEKPLGEWNRMEILCEKDAISIWVNGILQNEATETSQSKGKIGLQSEGAPIEYRNIELTPLEE